jgi:hypothetical protein
LNIVYQTSKKLTESSRVGKTLNIIIMKKTFFSSPILLIGGGVADTAEKK